MRRRRTGGKREDSAQQTLTSNMTNPYPRHSPGLSFAMMALADTMLPNLRVRRCGQARGEVSARGCAGCLTSIDTRRTQEDKTPTQERLICCREASGNSGCCGADTSSAGAFAHARHAQGCACIESDRAVLRIRSIPACARWGGGEGTDGPNIARRSSLRVVGGSPET